MKISYVGQVTIQWNFEGHLTPTVKIEPCSHVIVFNYQSHLHGTILFFVMESAGA